MLIIIIFIIAALNLVHRVQDENGLVTIVSIVGKAGHDQPISF